VGEGARIALALDAIVARLLEVAAALRERLPEARAAIAESVRLRLREWTRETGVDEERLLSEIAVLAEKSDVQEEMDRLAAHLEQLHEVVRRIWTDRPAPRLPGPGAPPGAQYAVRQVPRHARRAARSRRPVAL
jgi:hypothetical protein